AYPGREHLERMPQVLLSRQRVARDFNDDVERSRSEHDADEHPHRELAIAFEVARRIRRSALHELAQDPGSQQETDGDHHAEGAHREIDPGDREQNRMHRGTGGGAWDCRDRLREVSNPPRAFPAPCRYSAAPQSSRTGSRSTHFAQGWPSNVPIVRSRSQDARVSMEEQLSPAGARSRQPVKVFIEGHYRKLSRDLPQTVFFCPDCKGHPRRRRG